MRSWKRFTKARHGDYFVVERTTTAVEVWMSRAGARYTTRRVHIRFDAGEMMRVWATQPRKRLLWLDSESGRLIGIGHDQAYELGGVFHDRLSAEVARQGGVAL